VAETLVVVEKKRVVKIKALDRTGTQTRERAVGVMVHVCLRVWVYNCLSGDTEFIPWVSNVEVKGLPILLST
jgi:hypothetical protein